MDDRVERDVELAGAPLSLSCPNCSGRLRGQTCKLRCTRCGYFESCSDLEPAPPLPGGSR